MRSMDILSQKETIYRCLFWMAVTASAVIFFWGIWSIPILSLNEGRRMLVVKEMLSHHNWLIPTLNEKAYITKPPLFYWIAGLFGLIFRTSAEWVVRLPSSLSALLLTWFTFSRLKRQLGPWPALFAVLILVTSFKFTLYARRGEIEMLLALCCTLAIFFFLDYLRRPEGRWPLYLSYLFWGLAFLTKGPAALPFLLPPLLALWLITRDRNILRGLFFLPGWILCSLVSLPWYLYCAFQLSGGHWEVFLRNDVLGKTFWSKERDPFYGYLLEMVVNFSPWIMVILYKTRDRVRAISSSYETKFFGCWFLAPLIVMTFFSTQHTKYILPLFPAGAAVLGLWIAHAFADLRRRFGIRADRAALLVLGVLLLGWSLYYVWVEPHALSYRYRSIKPMIERVTEVQGSAPLFSYKRQFERLIYYYQSPIPRISSGELKEMLNKRSSFLLIAEDRDWVELEGSGLCLLGEYRPFLQRKKAARLLGSPDFCQGTEGRSISSPLLRGRESPGERKEGMGSP